MDPLPRADLVRLASAEQHRCSVRRKPFHVFDTQRHKLCPSTHGVIGQQQQGPVSQPMQIVPGHRNQLVENGEGDGVGLIKTIAQLPVKFSEGQFDF